VYKSSSAHEANSRPSFPVTRIATRIGATSFASNALLRLRLIDHDLAVHRWMNFAMEVELTAGILAETDRDAGTGIQQT
jgi:hypothetical protein